MRRRALLFVAASASLAGCGAFGDDDEDVSLESPGTDDEPIDRQPEALLLSPEDLDPEWSDRESDEENCRSFHRETHNARTDLTTCVEVLADVEAAREVYDTWVDQSRKLTGSLLEWEPTVGVEAAVIRGGVDFDVVFRDANAVGLVEYEMSVDGRLAEEEIPGPRDVVTYAVLMHRHWRE